MGWWFVSSLLKITRSQINIESHVSIHPLNFLFEVIDVFLRDENLSHQSIISQIFHLVA